MILDSVIFLVPVLFRSDGSVSGGSGSGGSGSDGNGFREVWFWGL
jgi:hypothetical protein